MSTRTQIYLDERQRKALKLMAATSDSSMSDLIRRAVDRLLSDEFAGRDWATEMRSAVESIRETGPDLADDELDALGEARRHIVAERGAKYAHTGKTVEKRKVHA